MGYPVDLSNTWFEIDQSLHDVDTPIITTDHMGNAVIIDRGVDDAHGRFYIYTTYINSPVHSPDCEYIGNQIFYEDGTIHIDERPTKVLLN